MSLADNLRKNIKKNKGLTSSEEEVRDLINSAASKSLKQFINRLESGEIPIDNVADFSRIIGVYKEINEIENTMAGSGGQATLPEINLRQERVFNELETKGKITKEDDDTIDISELTTEDVSDLIRDMDIAQNKENEETF